MDTATRNRIQKLRQAVRGGKSRIFTRVVVESVPTEATVSGVSFRTLENGSVVVQATTALGTVETNLDSFFRYL